MALWLHQVVEEEKWDQAVNLDLPSVHNRTVRDLTRAKKLLANKGSSRLRISSGRAWNNPSVTNGTRKKIIRLLISEIVVDIGTDTISLIIHWQGGDHTRLEVTKNRAGQTRWSTDADVIDLIRVLARQMPDTSIAAALNRSEKQTGTGQ